MISIIIIDFMAYLIGLTHMTVLMHTKIIDPYLNTQWGLGVAGADVATEFYHAHISMWLVLLRSRRL